MEIIAQSPETVKQLQGTYQTQFGNSYSNNTALTTAFSAAALLTENTPCQTAIATTLDAADAVLAAFTVLERYVQLTIPKMEDGGNFGVGIQLAAIKVLADQTDRIEKGVEELYKYAASRADALEKCKLPSSSETKSSTTSSSESAGTDAEKGATKSNATSSNSETKSVATATTLAEAALRHQAVAAVDVRFYTKAKATLSATITAFLLAVDFVDKNKVKIAAPKGENGGSRNYSGSMY